MSLSDIASTLPNGFHDAKLKRIETDYTSQEVRFFLNVWVGDVSSNEGSIREAHRAAVVSITGLVYFVTEQPDSNRTRRHSTEGLIIDVGPLSDLRAAGRFGLPTPAFDGAFENWIFVNDWNAFMYISARAANLEWLE